MKLLSISARGKRKCLYVFFCFLFFYFVYNPSRGVRRHFNAFTFLLSFKYEKYRRRWMGREEVMNERDFRMAGRHWPLNVERWMDDVYVNVYNIYAALCLFFFLRDNDRWHLLFARANSWIPFVFFSFWSVFFCISAA